MPHNSENSSAGRLRWWTAKRSTAELLAAISLMVFESAPVRAEDPAVAMRERFLGPTGLPSEAAYAQSNGILPVPGSEVFDWQVVFKLTYRSADLVRASDAQVVHTDCYFVRTRKYVAPHGVQHVWDGRVYWANDQLTVGAYTKRCERVAGHIDEQSCTVRSIPADDGIAMPELGGVQYNPFTGQLWRLARGGEIEEQLRFHLPITLVNVRGELVHPAFKIVETKGNEFSLVARLGDNQATLATCALGDASARKGRPGYSPVLAPGCTMITNEPTTVLEAPGQIATEWLDVRAAQLVLRRDWPSPPESTPTALAGDRPLVRIDGAFDEWRSLPGIADPEGDVVSYLKYNPDTDLLELKVANDDEYLYFYTRVAGQHGKTDEGRDRYYFYIYIDADRNPATGYIPTRDDDCYFGVALGDDCEAQFEFVGGSFLKTFYGFAGRGAEKEILTGQVALGPSWYNRLDSQGRLRDSYKVEYIRRAGEISITEDFTEGTGDDISIALSPDGSECEMRAAMSGFLRDSNGKPVIAVG